jgi:hypothetical protein
MHSAKRRQRQGKERGIVQCVNDIFLYGFPHAKKVITYQQNPKLNLIIINKWIEKAKMLWEDREREDLFTDE